MSRESSSHRWICAIPARLGAEYAHLHVVTNARYSSESSAFPQLDSSYSLVSVMGLVVYPGEFTKRLISSTSKCTKPRPEAVSEDGSSERTSCIHSTMISISQSIHGLPAQRGEHFKQ